MSKRKRVDKMIIYNQDRIGIKYLTNDNVIFEINSTKKLDELLQMMLDGEDITSVAAINGVIVKNEDGSALYIPYQIYGAHEVPNEFSEHMEDSISVPNYLQVIDEDYDDDYDDYVPDAGEMPYMQVREEYLFSQYEKRMMGARDAKLEFLPYMIDTEEKKNILKEQIAYSLGIMPTILHAEEAQGKTVAELKKLSQAADIGYDHGIADYYSNTYPNLLPTYKTAKVLASLSNSERELFTGGILNTTYNPTFLTDLVVHKKEKYGNRVLLTVNDIFVLRDATSRVMDNARLLDFPELQEMFRSEPTKRAYEKRYTKAFVEEVTKQFNEKFHFVPRVVDDYCYAYTKMLDLNDKRSDKELAKELVNEFSRTSLSKVAAYKNIVLYGLSSKLNFAEIREDHMLALGTFFSENWLNKLEDNHFIDYYKKYNDMSLGELTKLLRLYCGHQDRTFDVEKPPKQLIAEIENERGVKDCSIMEEKYDYHFEDNDIAIRGRNIMAVDGTMKMYMLPADDYRNFTTGYDTHCCQHYNDAGESCVWKLTTDPFAANVVIERAGKILAQGFVWTDEAKDTIVFDNVEFADDRSVQQFNDLFAEWSAAMPYKNVHVGVGYNQGMQSWGTKINPAQQCTMPTTLSNRHVYSDYHNNARTLKNNGVMKISATKPVRIIQQQLVPSKYDTLNELGLTYLTSTGFGIDKLFEIAAKLREETLTEAEYKDLFRACRDKAALLNNMSHIPESIQLWLIDIAPNCADFIQNPCDAVLIRQVEQNPAKIRLIDNPSEEIQLSVVRRNGMYLTEIANPTEAVIEEAVRQNGVAITMVPPERQTDTLKMLAIQSWAKVIASIENPTAEMIDAALALEPTAVSLIRGEIPLSCQLHLVEAHPSAINDIPTPHPTAVQKAIEKDGMLIRNYQNSYPGLRMIALAQNPFAIGTLNRPTVEEIVFAIQSNPKTAQTVRDKTALARAEAALLEQDSDLSNDYEEDEDIEMAI